MSHVGSPAEVDEIPTLVHCCLVFFYFLVQDATLELVVLHENRAKFIYLKKLPADEINIESIELFQVEIEDEKTLKNKKSTIL